MGDFAKQLQRNLKPSPEEIYRGKDICDKTDRHVWVDLEEWDEKKKAWLDYTGCERCGKKAY